MSRFFRTHAPAAAWAVLIFILSSIPRLHPPDLGFHAQDKLAHAVVYAVFGWLLSRSFGACVTNRRGAVFLVILLGTAYAASDELHQKFVPGRCADGYDFLADVFGLVFSQMAVFIKKRRG